MKGSVHQLPSGKWRVQVRGESVGVYPTYEEADLVRQGYVDGLQRIDAGDSLVSYGATFFDRREKSGRVRGVKKERSRWDARVATAPFAFLPLDKIKRRDIALWVRELLESPAYDTITFGRGETKRTARRPTGKCLKRPTVVDCLSLLRICLREAADDGLIEANPAGDVKVPKTAPSDPAWTWLTPEEIDRVTAGELEEWRRLLFTVAVYTGLRASELWRLRWERVRLDDGPPRVEVRAPAKSEHSIRDVPLLPPAEAAMRRLRDWGGVRHATGLVWPRDDGDAHDEYDAGWADQREKRLDENGKPYIHTRPGAKTRAGIERAARFHDLRHTCASHLVQGTWHTRPLSTEEVRQWMGHASIAVTQRYAHLRPDGLHAVPVDFRTQKTHAHTAEILTMRNEWAVRDSNPGPSG